MGSVSATISNLRIHEQELACTVTIGGDPGGLASALMVVYDAGGTERSRLDLGQLEVGQSWDYQLPLDTSSLEDGDYGAWLYVYPSGDGSAGTGAEQGVSFLVGRGQVYPSREAVDKRSVTNTIEASNIRLEASRVVFDMKNTATYDVEVAHSIGISDGSQKVHEAHGEELVRAGATQQGHYLLPEAMADGRYSMMVVVQPQGSDVQNPVTLDIEVRQGVVTVVP
jgi:hypothetical protein